MCILVGCEACFLSHHKKGQNSYFSDFLVSSIGYLAPAKGNPCSRTGLVTQESRTWELGLCISMGVQALAVTVNGRGVFSCPLLAQGSCLHLCLRCLLSIKVWLYTIPDILGPS